MQWTTEQEAAIASRHQNLLVSAAAGSGKTALLIERIRRLVVDEDVDVESLLVLTFTRAAAGEMRERLSAALSKELEACADAAKRRRLSNQLRRLSGASIETIDVFCGNLVREFFQEVDADPNYRIGDAVELDRLQDEAMTTVFEDRYLAIPEDGETAFSKLVDAYGGSKGDEGLRTLVLELWHFLGTLKDPDSWCQRALDQLKVTPESFEESAWGEAQKASIRSLIESVCQEITQIQAMIADYPGFEKPMNSLQKDLDKLLDLKKHLADVWQVFQQVLQTFKFDNYSGSEEDKETSNKIKDLRTATIQPIKDLVKQFKRPLPEMLEDLQAMAAPMTALIDLTKAFDAEFARLKKEREMLDFDDVERYAQKILANDAIAEILQKRYSQVFIDEYQDTNAVQEAILSRVCRADNYFMVGDVKQSIYRFRQADPTIFIEKYQRFQKQEAATDRLITLGRNFRSNQGIIHCVNDVFSRIMSPELGEITYDDDAALIFGLENSSHSLEPAELCVLESSSTDRIEVEARYIAARIHEMVGREQWIAKESENGVSRPLRYRDICVLMRKVSGSGETVARILADAGIPTYFDAGASYYQSIEIIVVLNLIRVIDNYQQDLPLLSVMRSPIGRFSDEELAAIRIGAKNRPFYQSLEAAAKTQTALGQKARMLLDHLTRWRKLAYTQSVADFLWQLYLETGYYTAVGALPGGEQRQKNLRVLLQRAAAYQEATLHGVFQFPDYAQPLAKRRQGDERTPSILSENDDVVRIMTIHKSKGLEFPVVFLADCGKGANLKNATGKVYFHQKLGICPKWMDPRAKLYHDTLATALVKEQVKTESLSEEIRLLYVAMTRAMAKLIMVGSVADLEKEKKRWEKPCTVSNLKKGRQGSGVSYLDWLMMACYRPGAAQNSVSPALKIKIEEETTRDAVAQERPVRQPELSAKQFQEIKRRLAWHYPAPAAQAPSKLSVTEIERLRGQQDPAEGPIEIPERITRPAFMAEAGSRHWLPSELGTGIHTLLQRIDLDKVRACGGDAAKIAAVVRAEATRLAELDILEAELVKALDLRPVVWLLGSPVGSRLLRAGTRKRELPFNFAVPGQRINPAYGKETVLLQGMIDCCFIEDDQWILLDYKTDRWHSQAGRDRLIARYQVQIDVYARALAAITGRPVAEKYLLFIAMNEAVKLPPAKK